MSHQRGVLMTERWKRKDISLLHDMIKWSKARYNIYWKIIYLILNGHMYTVSQEVVLFISDAVYIYRALMNNGSRPVR